MRLAYLFLQSRRTGWAAVYLACVVAAVAVLRRILAETSSQVSGDPLTNEGSGDPVLLLLVFLPLALAMVIGVGTHGPFGEIERTVSRPLPPLRLGHVAGLLAIGAAALFLIALTWQGDAERVFLRNLAGFAGLALLPVPLIGARLSWVLPFAFGMLAFWVGSNTRDGVTRWAWPMWPANDGLAMGIALGLLALGLVVAVLFGARDSKDEAE